MTASPAAQTEDRTEALWVRYRSAGDAEARAQLLVRHLGLVHHVAREVSRRIPSVELGELVSAGALGLMKALDSFDLSRGLAFSTYAVLRIRGAILDDLRSRDSTPRSVRVKRRRIEAIAAALEARLGRTPTPQEVAAHLGIDITTYWKWKDAVGVYAEAETPRPSHGRRFSRDAETHADGAADAVARLDIDPLRRRTGIHRRLQRHRAANIVDVSQIAEEDDRIRRIDRGHAGMDSPEARARRQLCRDSGIEVERNIEGASARIRFDEKIGDEIGQDVAAGIDLIMRAKLHVADIIAFRVR